MGKERGSDDGRRRGHQTRVARTRAALVGALVDLVDEDVARGGSGMHISPNAVARRAEVSTSTLYNRFPGGIPDIAAEAASRAHASQIKPLTALVALAAAHNAQARVRSEGEDRIRADLVALPIDPINLKDNEQATLKSLLKRVDRGWVSPELASRVYLYASHADGIDLRERYLNAGRAAEVLRGNAGLAGQRRVALLRVLTTAGEGAKPCEWGEVLQVAETLEDMTSKDEGEHWWVRLDRALIQRALSGRDVSTINDIFVEYLDGLADVPNAAVGDRLVSEAAAMASNAAQAGFLEADVARRAARMTYELEQRGTCSTRWTLTQVFRLQLVVSSLDGNVNIDTFFDPKDVGLFGQSTGLFWAPFALVLRRNIGVSSTPAGELAFLRHVCNSLWLTSEERQMLAVQLAIQDSDERTVAARDLPVEDDPASGLVRDLGEVVHQLMVVQPQSEQLRDQARIWASLLQDELLEPS